MDIRAFRKAGHTPSLVAALAHFDVSFMVWVMLGALGAYISEDLALSASEKGLLVAVPLVSAAAFRIVLGVLGDRFGPKRVGMVSLSFVAVPLLYAWLGAGLVFAVAMGLIGGLLPAFRAARLPITSALREA